MKQFFGILNLILCLELIVGPLDLRLNILSVGVAQADSCPKGTTFDSVLNRCLTSAQASEVRHAVSRCEATDHECYRSNAQSQLDKAEKDGDVSGKADLKGGFMNVTNKVVQGAAIAVPLAIAVNSMKDINQNSCSSISFWTLVGGAVALYAGDTLANYLHGDRLDGIQDEWDNIIADGAAEETDKDQQRINSNEAQSQAFEMLARSEDSMAAAAEMKAWFYGAAALSFATSAGFAIYEMTPAGAATNAGGFCESDENKEKNEKDAQEKAAADKKAAQEKAATDQEAANQRELEQAKARGKAEEQGRIEAREEHAARTAGSNGGNNTTGGSDAAGTAGSNGGNNTTGGSDAAGSSSGSGGGTTSSGSGGGTTSSGSGGGTTTSGSGGVTDSIKNDDIESLYAFMQERNDDSWEQEILKRKNLENLQTAEDLASFYILSKANNNKYSSPSIDQYEDVKEFTDATMEESPELLSLLKTVAKVMLSNLSPVSEAHATMEEESREEAKSYKDIAIAALPLAGAAVGAAAGLIFKDVSKWLSTPVGRLTVSGTFAVWSGVMVGVAIDQKNKSEERAEFLRKMRDDFDDAGGAINQCTPENRNDPMVPSCYCYTAEGKRNANRTMSDICQKLWTGKTLPGESYYGKTAGAPSGCIERNGQNDPKCECRRSRSCLKIVPSILPKMNLGSFSMLGSGLQPAQDMANGSFDSASASPAGLANQAMRVMRANEKILKKKQFSKARNMKNKLQPVIEKKLKAAASGISPMQTSGSSMPMNPQQAVAALSKELKEKKTEYKMPEKSSSSGAATPKKDNLDDLEFGLTSADLAAQQDQISDIMAKKMDYGENDINQGSSANIFEVLSNRYMRSGMRRLFDDEGKTQADKPAETDINQ